MQLYKVLRDTSKSRKTLLSVYTAIKALQWLENYNKSITFAQQQFYCANSYKVIR